ncbi:DUF3313 domain-containing protein [Agrobacterium sp. MS2]|nr:DUF3313 domain-containing protein [Agrobacterium sp. MS2]
MGDEGSRIRTVPPAWIRIFAACATVLTISGCATTSTPSQALSSSAVLRPTSDAKKPYAYQRAGTDFSSYSRAIILPASIYAGPDAQFGKLSDGDQQTLAAYMSTQFVKVLGKRFQLVSQPGPGTLSIKLTLTGAKSSTPVLSTVSHVLPVGLVINAGAQVAGRPGTFSGWVSYAVEIEDAETGTLLYAYVGSSSANALDITSNFRGLDAAKAGIRSASEGLDKELSTYPR